MDSGRHWQRCKLLIQRHFWSHRYPPENIEPKVTQLIWFTGRSITSIGNITLLLSIGGHSHLIEFLIVDALSSYNGILGCPVLNNLWATISTYLATIEVHIGNSRYTISRECLITDKHDAKTSALQNSLYSSTRENFEPQGDFEMLVLVINTRSEELKSASHC